VPVTGVEALLVGAPNANPPAPLPLPLPLPAAAGGWPKGGAGAVVDGAAPKGVADLGALNGDEGAVCPNGCAVDGALPNAPFEAAGGAPNVNGVLERAGS
jgi:hypothetical protein